MIDAAAIAALARRTPTQAPAPVVTETVRVVPLTAQAGHLLKADADWTAKDLQTYVMGEIERLHGAQVRNPIKENAIFGSFMARWGSQAAAIARFAFEVERGWWNRAPISATRFTKGSDPYFAVLIADRLNA